MNNNDTLLDNEIVNTDNNYSINIIIYLFIPLYLIIMISLCVYVIKRLYKKRKNNKIVNNFIISNNIITFNINGNKPDNCVICMENKCNSLIIPCNHCILCENCVKILIETKQMLCPYCRIKFDKYSLL